MGQEKVEVRHTAGPWKAAGEEVLASHPGATLHVARVWNVERYNGSTGANARLIAAAPELLESCKAVAALQASTEGKGLLDVSSVALLEAYRQVACAIAKAEGRGE